MLTAPAVLAELQSFLEAGRGAPAKALDPGHRKPFHWPPPPVSAQYHVLKSDWTGMARLHRGTESFEVLVAKTAYGVFGRCDELWCEARGDTQEQMLQHLEAVCRPLFRRQEAINAVLGRKGRFTGHVSDLGPADWVKLLYCPDREVGHEAATLIEEHASTGLFGEALVTILRDCCHPYRRAAQWCVLDIFEDLPSHFPTEELQKAPISAIRDLIWTAEDDYARAVYKAGVVLGGHICTEPAARALMECVFAPSEIGRRSAIHASFHLAEWLPEWRLPIVETLQRAAESDSNVSLREYAAEMARDIHSGAIEHVIEPLFGYEK